MPLSPASEDAADTTRDWTSAPAAALTVISKHATTRTTPGGCRLARVCSGWRSAVRSSGPVVIRRGASIGTSMPMCASLSQWLGSNGAGLVCLQLQGLSGSGEGSTTSTIISGLYRAASTAAAAGAHLHLQQLCLDGNSLQPAMRLLPLLPNLQQVELTGINLCVQPDKEVYSCRTLEPRLQQLQEHQGITRLAFNFAVTPDFSSAAVAAATYGSMVASRLLTTGCPQQLQDLTLRWHPAASPFGYAMRCSIHLKQLAHLTQLRKLTLDQVVLHVPHDPQDAEVDAEVVERLEQVRLLCPDVNNMNQQLDPQGLPALLPKLVELHATRPTFTEVEVLAAATNLTSIRVGEATYDLLSPNHLSTVELFRGMSSLQQLRKLVLPRISTMDPYSMSMFLKTMGLEQLQHLSLTVADSCIGAPKLLTGLQHLSSLSLQIVANPSTFTPAVLYKALWQEGGLSQLHTLQHLALEAPLLAAAPTAALEALTALTSMTTSFVGDQQWREDVTRAAAVLSSCPALHQRLRVVYATGVVAGGVHKVYRALRRALPRTRVEVVTGPSVPGWLRVAA